MQQYMVNYRQAGILFFILIIVLHSCTVVRKAPDRPYIIRNTVEVKGGNFSRSEKTAVEQRLENQIDDSASVTSTTSFFLFNTIKRPNVYDSVYAAISAVNMRASMFNLGYYNASANYNADTSGKKVYVKYTVEAGRPTLIDTVTYRLRRADLQGMIMASRDKAILQKNNPITKGGVTGEIARLVDTFRNNGYYKFTAAELRVLGDTTIEALTTVTDDPFEQLRLLAEAEQQRDSPTIRVAVALNPPSDTSRLTKYYINKVYILPDFYPGDQWSDSNVKQVTMPDFAVRYREYLFKTSFLGRSLTMKNGDLYRQREFVNTVNNFTRAGVWKSVNARLWEVPGDTNKVNLVIELMPARKFAAEASVQASYSATSNSNNALAGNLFGLSLNLGLTNRNVRKEAIRMTHAVRAGIELNNNSRNESVRLINSQELSYGNTITFPRLIWPFPAKHRNKFSFPESFINTNLAFNNRLDLFNMQSVNLNFGYNFNNRKGWKWTVRPVNIEFNYLYNQTDSFKSIVNDSFPFLRYSYNSAFILGTSFGISHSYVYPKHLHSLSRERSIRVNIEQSFFPSALLPILEKYKYEYVKVDLDYRYTVTYNKTALAFRGFLGIGIPFANDTALPFFKQYFGGGSNSMRGWPIRGIGPGTQKLIPFGQNVFNNRTGDIQVEGNAEYRYDIARIIPNTLTLRGALFVDVGNIWNFRKRTVDGIPDSSQFRIKHFYRDLGVAAGTGFRIDLNYFIVRLDLGFRLKRPEIAEKHNGWKFPDIGFDDLGSKLFGRSDANRRWRYENFNFTVGISYPF